MKSLARSFGTAVAVLWIGLNAAGANAQPPACPRPAIARLMALAGEWTVAWDSRVNDTLVAVSNAHATITPANAGCGLVERLEGQLRGTAMGLTTLISAPAADSLELAYADSDHGGVLIFEGSIHGDTVQFAWSRELGTRRQMVRREYSGITSTRFTTRTLMSPDSGNNWILVQRARYERRR
jgi:hypothetical protein